MLCMYVSSSRYGLFGFRRTFGASSRYIVILAKQAAQMVNIVSSGVFFAVLGIFYSPPGILYTGPRTFYTSVELFYASL
jgi:hypothetical protein